MRVDSPRPGTYRRRSSRRGTSAASTSKGAWSTSSMITHLPCSPPALSARGLPGELAGRRAHHVRPEQRLAVRLRVEVQDDEIVVTRPRRHLLQNGVCSPPAGPSRKRAVLAQSQSCGLDVARRKFRVRTKARPGNSARRTRRPYGRRRAPTRPRTTPDRVGANLDAAHVRASASAGRSASKRGSAFAGVTPASSASSASSRDDTPPRSRRGVLGAARRRRTRRRSWNGSRPKQCAAARSSATAAQDERWAAHLSAKATPGVGVRRLVLNLSRAATPLGSANTRSSAIATVHRTSARAWRSSRSNGAVFHERVADERSRRRRAVVAAAAAGPGNASFVFVPAAPSWSNASSRRTHARATSRTCASESARRSSVSSSFDAVARPSTHLLLRRLFVLLVLLGVLLLGRPARARDARERRRGASRVPRAAMGLTCGRS